MKVLLVEPKIKRSWNVHNQFTGLLRIANWLKATGNDIEYIKYPNLATNTPDEVYITSMFTYSYPEVWEAVRFYKNWYPQANIKLGGVYPSLCPDHAAKSGADEIMIGQHPQARFYPPDPSMLPERPEYAYLFTSYGCNYNCTFCATHKLFGEGIKQLEPGRVIEEIEFVVSRGFYKVRFGDDNILYNSENHLNHICEGLLQRQIKKLELIVTGGMVARDFNLETARLMKAAGFKHISFGLESIDTDILKKMGRAKNTQVDDIERMATICDEVGFGRSNINLFFVIGLPYQKLEDMVATLAYLLKLGFWAHPQRFTPIPSTPIFKQLGLEDYDLADLHYKKFLAPNQDNFTSDDLDAIYGIARAINMGRRYSSFNFLDGNDRVAEMFRKELQ